ALDRCAGGDDQPLGHEGVRGPDLLARDAPAVAIGSGSRPQRRQVRAGVGFAEALTPDDVTRGEGRGVLGALLLGAGPPHGPRCPGVRTRSGSFPPVSTHLPCGPVAAGPPLPPWRTSFFPPPEPPPPNPPAPPGASTPPPASTLQNRCVVARSSGSSVQAPM